MMSDGMVITCSFLGHSISLAVLGGMLLVIIYQYQVSYHAQKSYLVLVVCRVMFVSVALPLTLKLTELQLQAHDTCYISRRLRRWYPPFVFLESDLLKISTP